MEWLWWWMARHSLADAGNGDGGRSTLRLLLQASATATVEQRNGNGECGAVRTGAGEVKALSGPPWPHAARHRRRATSAGHHAAAQL